MGDGKMKKCITIILVFMLLCFSGCVKLDEVSLFYDSIEWADGLNFAINNKAKCCFAGYYEYNGKNGRDIVIPDEYSGYPVTRLGGYYGRGLPIPFYVILSDEFCNFEGECIEGPIPAEDAEIIEIVFNLKIGKNLDEIVYVEDLYSMGTNKEGKKIAYHPTVYITCSEENEHFYSEKGKLYTKDGTLVDEFAYSEFPAE